MPAKRSSEQVEELFGRGKANPLDPREESPATELPNVAVVLARCQSSQQTFGIRLEAKMSNQWSADWAFLIKSDRSAAREGYESRDISGAFTLDPGYPGCPSCGAGGFFRCECGRVACWDGRSQKVTCPWCKSAKTIRGSIGSLSAAPDQ